MAAILRYQILLINSRVVEVCRGKSTDLCTAGVIDIGTNSIQSDERHADQAAGMSRIGEVLHVIREIYVHQHIIVHSFCDETTALFEGQ